MLLHRIFRYPKTLFAGLGVSLAVAGAIHLGLTRHTPAPAPEPAHAAEVLPALNWTLPKAYRAKTLRARVRHFPHKLIALTFDDGPDPIITPKVLRILKQHRAKATFFVLGVQAQRYPQLVQDVAADGHAIGLHSYTHPMHPTKEQAAWEVLGTAQLVKQITGRESRLFRPPYGNMRSPVVPVAKAAGYTIVLWTIDPHDSRKGISAAAIANGAIHTPDPGDIIILHDGPGRTRTVEALPTILASLAKHGYRFVTIPELTVAWETFKAQSL